MMQGVGLIKGEYGKEQAGADAKCSESMIRRLECKPTVGRRLVPSRR